MVMRFMLLPPQRLHHEPFVGLHCGRHGNRKILCTRGATEALMCGRIERAPGAGGQLGPGSDRYALSWVSAVRAVTTLVPFAGAVEGRGCCCAPAANNGLETAHLTFRTRCQFPLFVRSGS